VTRARLVVALAAAFAGAGSTACAIRVSQPPTTSAPAAAAFEGPAGKLTADLDRILDAPALARASIAIHIESLADGRVLYGRAAESRMVPASALKIVTAAVAAERLGWTHRFETRLEVSGRVVDGVLQGDLVVVGGGDPAIDAQDLRTAPLFEQWTDALRAEGITRVDGRLVGDDSAFEDEPIGAGWAWDYLTAAYAAPSGALSYNGNLVAVRITPAAIPGAPATIVIAPPGHGLTVGNHVTTGPAGDTASVALARLPGSSTLIVRGRVPAASADVVRVTTVENPTTFFVEGLRRALASRGIRVRDGAWDVDALRPDETPTPRRVIATHQSPPLSSLVAQMMKVSQNFYGEMLIKAIGRTAAGAAGVGSTERGRQVIRQTLDGWRIPSDALVMHDGSGLSRYNYASARLLTGVLRRMWHDERHRGPFAAALPVAGHDGTLGSRMTEALRRRVQAKTGTIANVRSLAGYAETEGGEKIVFAMIANHFVAPNAEIDRVMEEVLARVGEEQDGQDGQVR